MNSSTYARLIKPKQFKPDESVKFRMEFSQDLICCWATLKIYGYSLTIDGTEYTGTSVTEYINVSWLGTGYIEFTVPANTLAVNPTSDNYGFSGRIKAVVEIGLNKDENGNAISQFKSNEVLVDMLVQLPDDFKIVNTPLTASGSTKAIEIRYVTRTTLGNYGANNINSYQVLLYDSNYNLVSDSGTLYDWENNSIIYKKYTLKNLADNSNYYVRVKATLEGGYTLSTDYTPLSVKYDTTPLPSSNLALENDIVRGRVRIGIETDVLHDKIIVSRTIKDAADYLEVLSIKSRDNTVVLYDNYALPNCTYTYKVVLLSGDTVADTYYNSITHKFDGVCVADAYGCYNAIAFEKKYPVNKNDRAGIVEPMDSVYPTAIINSPLDYDSGSITATFAYIEKCEPDFANNVEYSKTIRHWLNNGRNKLLKYYNGECWLVSVSGVTDDEPKGSDVITTSFNWTQVGDPYDNTAYAELGLILNE